MKFRVTNPSNVPVSLNVVANGAIQSCQLFPGTHVVSADSIPPQGVVRIEQIDKPKTAPVVQAPAPVQSSTSISFKKKD